MDVRNKKDLHGKKTLCPSVTFQWFSVQILSAIFQIFKLQLNFSFRFKSIEFYMIIHLFLSLTGICQQFSIVVTKTEKIPGGQSFLACFATLKRH